MKRWLFGVGILTLAAVWGCSQSVACRPVADGVGVCLDGKPVVWSVGAPHQHEVGGYYAPVDDLAKALGAKAVVSADKKGVFIGGKQVRALAAGAKSIHLHDAKVYAPIKEFAEAAGFKADVDTKQHTVNIHQ